jgi:hypothetical protein
MIISRLSRAQVIEAVKQTESQVVRKGRRLIRQELAPEILAKYKALSRARIAEILEQRKFERLRRRYGGRVRLTLEQGLQQERDKRIQKEALREQKMERWQKIINARGAKQIGVIKKKGKDIFGKQYQLPLNQEWFKQMETRYSEIEGV